MDKTFLKNLNIIRDEDKRKYVSQPKSDYMYQARKRLIKNYVLDPEIKLIG